VAVAGALLFGISGIVPAAGGPFGERCEYVEAGAPGPKGNRLVVVGAVEPWLVRRGNAILVHDPTVHCTGRQATVHNVDRVVLRVEDSRVSLSERRGDFAPGATSEHSGSEIEVDVYRASKLTVYGGRQRNSMRIGTRANGSVALNLNPVADSGAPDQDVTVRSDEFKAVKLYGEQGDDLIDARRLTGIGDNVYLTSRIRLIGGAGDDTILGGIEEEEFEDGPGDDLINAGGGDDAIAFGPGHDTVYGGLGRDGLFYEFIGLGKRSPDVPDRLYGGPGADILSDRNGQADQIRCGSGVDEVERESHDRLGPGCERYRRR
jgi:Ca2+-binding RTX toxin-like protein